MNIFVPGINKRFCREVTINRTACETRDFCEINAFWRLRLVRVFQRNEPPQPLDDET